MRNSYTSGLAHVLRNRYSIESSGMTTGQWLETNTVFKSRPFSFAGYEFQRGIADDLHPDLDVIKISQVGLTEVQQRKALSILVRNPGTVGIFSLPNEKMYRRFAQSRLKPLVDENKVFRMQSVEDPVRSMELMQFGTSFLNIVNATEGAATSISADFVFNDEVDLSDQKVIALFASRLQNSSMRIRQRFSTPTWIGYGIDGTYSASDQREYLARCAACRHWQVPLWDRRWVSIPNLGTDLSLLDITEGELDKLGLGDAQVVCEKCSAPLDLGALDREWVATYPSRTHARGYRVRPFSSSRLSIPYILTQMIDYQRRDFLRGWYNTVLGEPYTDSRARLDVSMIRKCLGSPEVPAVGREVPVFLGIDMGQVCYLTVGIFSGDQLVIVNFLPVRIERLHEVVGELRATYNIVGGACDRHPYTPDADRLRAVTQSRVVPVEYRGDVELRPVKGLDGAATHWRVNRTRMLDAVADRVRQGTVTFLGYGDQSSVLLTHFRDMIRDETPERPATWKKLSGNDHYFHSLAFLVAATKIQGINFQTGGDARTALLLTGLNFQHHK